MLKIGWFSTGRDEAASQLLQTVQEGISRGDIKGEIIFVFSNREPGESQESDSFFSLVQSYGIPLICLSYSKFKTSYCQKKDPHHLVQPGKNQLHPSRESCLLKYDREVNNRIKQFAPDLCVLAGYMLIVGRELCQKYNMINLHPAPPGGPVGSWQEVISRLIADKADNAGAMIHLVTPELDRGPVISYCLLPIKGKPFAPYWQNNDTDMLFKLIRQHELAREFPLIISTLQALSHGEMSIEAGKVVDSRGRAIDGCDLSDKINKNELNML